MSDRQQNTKQTPTDGADLRKRAEEKAGAMEPNSLSAQTPEAIQQMFHELRVHQIELEMQNEALQHSHERFRIAQEMSTDGFTILRPVRDARERVVDFTWVYENPAIARLNGTDPEAVVGRGLLELFPGHRGTPLLQAYQQVVESGEPQTIETGYCGESMEKPTWFRIVVVPLAGDIAILAQDITERKQAKEALRANEENLFESSRDAIMTLEPPSWDFTSGNPATVKMFGAKNENEFVSHGPWALSPERQPDGRASAEKAQEMIETAVREGSHFFEWTHRRIGGKDFPADVLLTRMEQAGKLLLQATVRDITERKRAEFERESTVRILEILNAETVLRKLMHSLLNFMQEITGCEALGIRLRKGDDFPYYEVSGFSDDFVASETRLCVEDLSGRLECDDIGNPVLECMCGNVIRGRFDSSKPFFTEFGSFVTNSTTRLLAGTSEQDRQTRTRKRCNGEGYESVLLIPLRTGGKTFGLLQFNDRQEGRFPQQIVNHLERIAGNVALALAQRESEKALKESEERFNLAMDASRDGVYEWDLETREIYYSPGWKRMLGYKPDELPNNFSVWEKLTRPEDVEKSWQIMKEVVEGKRERFELEFEMRHKDGHWIHILSRSNIYKDANGKPFRVVGTHVDITDSKHQRERLRLSESRYRKAQELGKVGNWEYNLKTTEFWNSDEAKKIFGFDPDKDSFSTEEVESCIIKREMVHQALVDLIENGKPYNLEYDIITKNTGKIKTIVSIAEIEKDGAKNPVKISGVIHDITERKQAEQEYQTLFNEMLNGFALHEIVCDATGAPADYRFLNVNPAFEHMTGLKAQEIVGKTILEILPDTERHWIETYGKIALTGEAAFFENYSAELKKHFEVTAFRPAPNQFACIFSDITERKRAEAEKEKLQAQLLQAQKMESVGRLAGGVAHDFNNMLGVILGHLEFALEKAEKNHDLYADLKEIQTAAQRSADLTRQLLTFARKQVIDPRKLDLNNTVESMLSMMRRLIGEDIDLVWQPATHLWPVKMDPSQIDQILANLCVNARDAIAGVGKLTIETGRHTFDEEYCNDHPGFIPGDFVLLAVSDNGCGMDKETLKNLFEPFFTTKDIGEGTGLGLATVYGIVKQNKGFINVYSEPDQGSIFRIYLPRYFAADETPAVIHPDKPVPTGNETILLVEDEPAILRMTRMMLERKGYSVLSVATPVEAIDLAKTHADKIDLLMTDVVMPEMNGRDLAGQLTALFPDIKILFMSGYTANVIAHQGVLDKGVAFIQKPFSMQELAEKVRGVLDNTPCKTR